MAADLGFGAACGWLGSSASVPPTTRRSSRGAGELGVGVHRSLSRREPLRHGGEREQGKEKKGKGEADLRDPRGGETSKGGRWYAGWPAVLGRKIGWAARLGKPAVKEEGAPIDLAGEVKAQN
jgi:hypothetical protein